jgi:hypothetical protein
MLTVGGKKMEKVEVLCKCGWSIIKEKAVHLKDVEDLVPRRCPKCKSENFDVKDVYGYRCINKEERGENGDKIVKVTELINKDIKFFTIVYQGSGNPAEEHVIKGVEFLNSNKEVIRDIGECWGKCCG